MKKIKFLVDENLLGLLRRLRIMGEDSISLMGASDDDVYFAALEQDRHILTKDRRFFSKLSSENEYFVKSETPKEQLAEVLMHFSEWREDEPLSRCLSCNTLIEKVDKESVRTRVDEKTFRLYDAFYECPTCHRIYWEGSHFEKLQKEVEDIKNQVKGLCAFNDLVSFKLSDLLEINAILSLLCSKISFSAESTWAVSCPSKVFGVASHSQENLQFLGVLYEEDHCLFFSNSVYYSPLFCFCSRRIEF